MCTGKINELCLLAVKGQYADVSFDGYARIIADALLETGQAIEQGAFAGIGVTNDSNAGLCGPSYCYLIGRDSDFGGFSHQLLRVQP